MSERMVKGNGIDIWTEDFGDAKDPTILLIMGASAQGIMWPDEFCEALAAGGRHVIRYDNRDTGQTTTFDFATQPYTASDMAADAVGVLDAYGVDRAHIAGASMGGMIAQTVAIEHPERVLTITSIMSSPLGAGLMAGFAGGDSPLPGPEQKVLDVIAATASPPANDEERIDRAVALWRALSGTMEPFDEATTRAREAQILARAKDIDAALNHQFAIGGSPDRTEALAGITAPTLVIHGTADPILPFPHGEATAKAIPGAELLAVEGMGHDIPAPAQPILVKAILDHTAA